MRVIENRHNFFMVNARKTITLKLSCFIQESKVAVKNSGNHCFIIGIDLKLKSFVSFPTDVFKKLDCSVAMLFNFAKVLLLSEKKKLILAKNYNCIISCIGLRSVCVS